jgi:hypothetical protein
MLTEILGKGKIAPLFDIKGLSRHHGSCPIEDQDQLDTVSDKGVINGTGHQIGFCRMSDKCVCVIPCGIIVGKPVKVIEIHPECADSLTEALPDTGLLELGVTVVQDSGRDEKKSGDEAEYADADDEGNLPVDFHESVHSVQQQFSLFVVPLFT